ncbi:MAG: Gfo/Idh/MocA family oxidoreductase [Candidatus Paceibacterota bacterium]|jgi:predicted dehydrogenase
MKNYILVGLGPHAKRIYYPFLEKHQTTHKINLKLIIDLKSQEEKITKYISGKNIKPEKILFIEDSVKNRMGKTIDIAAKKELNNLVKNCKIDGIIISTEPKAHKAYAIWAIKNNINILMDKPITAPVGLATKTSAAKKIYKDYTDLKNALDASQSKFYVVCQRRSHEGYNFIKSYLEKFLAEHKVPISYVDINHADGAWNLPHEFDKENHPYKYGYGKLMHSGYHFVDLLAWISKINTAHSGTGPDSVNLYTARFAPNDFFHQIQKENYRNFFGREETENFFQSYDPKKFDHFGELDAYALMQFKKEGRVVTTASLNLQQNSFSRRGWFDLPEDTYKGNGRVRHERVNIQVSHLLNIQVHSYQSYESTKTNEQNIASGEIGGKDHFDIYIFRNTNIVGGQAFTKISLGKTINKKNKKDTYYLGHNEKARETTLLNFINNKDDDSELKHHEFTNQLLSNIYLSMTKDAKTSNSRVSFKTKTELTRTSLNNKIQFKTCLPLALTRAAASGKMKRN